MQNYKYFSHLNRQNQERERARQNQEDDLLRKHLKMFQILVENNYNTRVAEAVYADRYPREETPAHGSFWK